jgi:uncharacterized protein (TIGR01777 family)
LGEIVLSGATGLVGGRLMEALAREGTAVRALTRNPGAASFSAPARAVGWDGLHVTPDALAGAAAVVHLAGEPIFGGLPTAKRRARMRESRVESARSVAAALAALPEEERPGTFVCASAVGYYGDRGEQILDEGAAPGKGFLAELCVDWEKAAGEAEAWGVRVVQVRIGVVLADTGGAPPLIATPFKLCVGGRLGSGKQWFPWIHIEDLVSMIRAALADERYQGPANAVAPGIVTNQDLTTALGALLSRPTLLPVPGFAVKALLGDLSSELLGSKRVIPTVAERNGFAFRYPELTPALEDLLG